MLIKGYRPEIARGILPNDLKTELIMIANLREQRHFFSLRDEQYAHPELKRITIQLLKKLIEKIPVVFDDLEKITE